MEKQQLGDPVNIVTTVHLRTSDFLVIAREVDVSGKLTRPAPEFLRPDQVGGQESRELVMIEYGPPEPDTGLPFPTRVRGVYTESGKPEAVCENVTFTEYRRATPADSELDAQAQFGAVLAPPDPRPPLPTDAELEAAEAAKRGSHIQFVPGVAPPPPPLLPALDERHRRLALGLLVAGLLIAVGAYWCFRTWR